MPVDGNGKFQLSGLRKGSDGKLPTGKLAPRSPKVESPEVKMHPGNEGDPEAKKITIHQNGDGSYMSEHHHSGEMHDHQNLDELKSSLGKFFDEESEEGDEPDHEAGMHEANKSHLGNFGGDVG